MKKIVLIAVLLTVLSFSSTLSAQSPPHPNGGSNPGGGNTAVGGNAGAPVGNGTFILLALALAYGGRKAYGNKNPLDN